MPDCGCWPLAVCEGCRSFVLQVYAFNNPALCCSPVTFAFGSGKFVWSRGTWEITNGSLIWQPSVILRGRDMPPM